MSRSCVRWPRDKLRARRGYQCDNRLAYTQVHGTRSHAVFLIYACRMLICSGSLLPSLLRSHRSRLCADYVTSPIYHVVSSRLVLRRTRANCVYGGRYFLLCEHASSVHDVRMCVGGVLYPADNYLPARKCAPTNVRETDGFLWCSMPATGTM